MLAVSTVMYAVSAVHWANNMAIAARSMRADAPLMSPFEMLIMVYLPTINVRHPFETSLETSAHCSEVYPKRWDRGMASLDGVGSESQIHHIHSPALLPRVHAQ